MLAEIPPPPAHSTHWRARLTHEASEEWRLYGRHPWMLTVLARTRPPLGPALFDIAERTLSTLDRPGLPPERMLAIYLSVSGLVQGLAPLWRSERADLIGGVELRAWSDARHGELLELLDPTTRPVLHRLFTNAPTGLDLDVDALLETGLPAARRRRDAPPAAHRIACAHDRCCRSFTRTGTGSHPNRRARHRCARHRIDLLGERPGDRAR
ncbi:TetR/AcrR family transcriptional regulator C-terminal domain-containing protein [Nocardia sp. NPDC051463]|uniref:TetR/AcrR family transcriptional regulator C-terminal domain-containing protein n=1 Tax=Nocardia sp. NPDC051463 TaxID=3154845 RepID=UPI00344FAE28